MPFIKYSQRRYFGTTEVIAFEHKRTWSVSHRVYGKLKLRANVFSREEAGILSYYRNPKGGLTPDTSGANPSVMLGSAYLYDALLASSYAKMRGKLYKGSASLGVTFGSWRQSREMIVTSYADLSRRADELSRWIGSRDPRKHARTVASAHLEVIFGWVPLLQDIHNSCMTVIQDGTPPVWVRARSYNVGTSTKVDTYVGATRVRTIALKSQVTRASQVEISNGNLWLLERAGLLNPLSVAWDLVPWSFVVNMFVNTGQLVNQITDYVGLRFSNASTTRSTVYQMKETLSDPKVFHGSRTSFGKEKYTTLGAVDRPPLVIRAPDVNWELAAMAASLFTQKFVKIP